MTKEEAITRIKDHIEIHRYHERNAVKIFEALDMAIKSLEQPEWRWTLCSEELPEDNQFVLMTIRRMNEHYNHEPFISIGYISWNQSAWWCAHDGDCKSNDVRVDAWMPLPASPYKERKNETDNSNQID